MSGVLRTSYQPMLPGMDSDTFSQESADGLKPCGSLDGHQAEASGLAPALVSPTRRRGSRRATKTNGICGQPSPASSESVALTQSLVNKCQELLGTGGSIEYTQTWKEKVTPSGIAYWEHTASKPRISDKDCTGWLTPRARGDAGGSRHEQGEVRNLEDQVQLVGWATPAARDYRSESATDEFNAERDSHPRGKPLSYQATLVGWATPTVQDHSRGVNPPRPTDTGVPLSQQVAGLGAVTESSSAETEKLAAYQLNPSFSRWLMGFPPAWCDCAVTAMLSCPRLRRFLSKHS